MKIALHYSIAYGDTCNDYVTILDHDDGIKVYRNIVHDEQLFNPDYKAPRAAYVEDGILHLFA